MGPLAAAFRCLHHPGRAVPQGRGHGIVRTRAAAAGRVHAKTHAGERRMNAATLTSPAARIQAGRADGAAGAAAYAYEARGVAKKFGANVVIEDLSIGFEPGMLHSILGPNGAGKTTLFNLLTRDLPVSAGEILLNGVPVTHLKPHQIARRGVGRSYQISSVYLELTFLENVWLAAYRACHGGRMGWWRRVASYGELRREAGELLRKLGLGQYENTPASAVSYGDQRLLEIAVTLATRPAILLLDEPTAGLSQRETERVKDFIAAIKPDYTIIMIEHKMNVVMEISDRIHVMNRGALIAAGTAEEISRNQAVHAAYFGL
ncbi:ABC transporter ATP-binding protein [Achromobacter aloeverae]|uniref:ABC transporter ATP-binding protein n=2 Tax=Achromobacter aloeverae TaxID=1750518 RepID=A0A4V1MS70_9BURK|nr:ABC transporter ATP-binding protein [Achromobacter aloeverae]